MTARMLLISAMALTSGLLLLAACGGNSKEQPATGVLTDSNTVPTATPWTEAPAPIILDPDALTPIAQDGEGDGQSDGEDGGEVASGECGDTYIVEAGDVPFAIAEKCGVAPDDVAAWVNDMLELNGIDDPTTLRVGQELKVP